MFYLYLYGVVGLVVLWGLLCCGLVLSLFESSHCMNMLVVD